MPTEIQPDKYVAKRETENAESEARMLHLQLKNFIRNLEHNPHIEHREKKRIKRELLTFKTLL